MTESEDATTSMDEGLDSEYMEEQEYATDRFDAARWLRKRVGVVAARDLPADPSEEDFRQGLRSGVMLCKVLNKIRSGSVPKVVNAPSALFNTPDADAQSAYFENVKNFLAASEELGLPTFEHSDLEPGGDFSSVVDCVLAMKAYSENESSDFTWTPRPSRSRKAAFMRRNSEPAMNAFARSQSVRIDQLLAADQFGDGDDLDDEFDSGPLYMIISDLLEDREKDDIPIIIENMLNKIKEEFKSRLGVKSDEDIGLSTIEAPKMVSSYEILCMVNYIKICVYLILDLIWLILNTEKKEQAIQNKSGEDEPAKQQEQINREKELLKKKEEDDKVAKEQERIKREKELLKKKEEDDKAAKEQERINKEKELLRKKEEEEAAAKEQERIRREKELEEIAKKKEEEERAAKEQERLERERLEKERLESERIERERLEKERIEREKELLRKKEEEEAAARELERIQREKELEEMAKKQEEEERAAKERERIKREKELLAQQEKARKEEEARIRREERELKRKEKARKKEEARIIREKKLLAEREKARKQEQERIKKERKELARQERARKREEERIRRENLSLAQKEKAREEQERIKKEIELLVQQEQAKDEEISAMEAESINKEKELLEEEEKARKEEEEQERIDKEREKERARKKDEYRRTMDEFKKLNVNTPKQSELVGQQDKELQDLRSTISTAKTEVRSMQNNCQDEADNLGTHVHTLCQAAAGYKKVLEENRKLYNQVQDLKGSIRVYCRVRPFLPEEKKQVTSVDYMDDETVAIIVPSKSGRESRKASMFNKVFGPSATQEEVFSDTQPLIRSVLDGFNVCVFACGQTGAGKTYTLTGPKELTPETMGGINVPDANLVPVSSTDEVINLIKLCQKNRAVNDHSSRSHSFLTAHVFGKDLTSGTTTRGCMHLVDLAGNEKLDDSDDEATHINKSLSALGDILVALANKSKNVPYKACKLTQYLQDAIGAQAKILMFVHVHPDIDEALETLSTFKFVERFSTLEGGAGKSSDVRELKEQICLLKSTLAKKESGDPQWQEMMNSPSGEQNGAFEDEQTDEKGKNSKQPAKAASAKKPTAATAAAAKPGKQATPDPKKKKGK
ncbi:hypothetical protein SSX86_032556 [Deinandra increscens subsp. villosa]|uniref:Uncharacterized protein n=1 Tax=Deinandra increscens subsp. villosa TaxID=3103831 RepID=A0AAP0GHN5_9ASTR